MGPRGQVAPSRHAGSGHRTGVGEGPAPDQARSCRVWVPGMGLAAGSRPGAGRIGGAWVCGVPLSRAWSACAGALVPATGLSLRSPGPPQIFPGHAAKTVGGPAAPVLCFLGPRGNILAGPGRPVCRAPASSARAPDRREGHHRPPGRHQRQPALPARRQGDAMNPITLTVTGRLGDDPRSFTTRDGTAGVELRLAVEIPAATTRTSPAGSRSSPSASWPPGPPNRSARATGSWLPPRT
jgi:hypothetical protein